ncbi:MAG: hypothetical protein QM731_01895 [Chitinophagaceae bacterium]
MKKIVLSLLVGFAVLTAVAQDNPNAKSPTYKEDKKKARRDHINELIKREEEGEIIFNKQSIFGIKLNTDGYGISYEFGRFKSARVANIFQFELNEKKHPKEKRTSSGDINGFSFNSVIYGKENNFYQFKIGAGQQRVIGGKGNKNGVAVMGIYTAGLSAGLQKPYMVNVSRFLNGGDQFRSTYPTIIDSGYYEIGAAGFTRGWDKVKLKPGAHAKLAMRFDYGRFNETVAAIEVGVNAEYYFSKVAQMAYSKDKNFFFNGYITLLFGRRK